MKTTKSNLLKLSIISLSLLFANNYAQMILPQDFYSKNLSQTVTPIKASIQKSTITQTLAQKASAFKDSCLSLKNTCVEKIKANPIKAAVFSVISVTVIATVIVACSLKYKKTNKKPSTDTPKDTTKPDKESQTSKQKTQETQENKNDNSGLIPNLYPSVQAKPNLQKQPSSESQFSKIPGVNNLLKNLNPDQSPVQIDPVFEHHDLLNDAANGAERSRKELENVAGEHGTSTQEQARLLEQIEKEKQKKQQNSEPEYHI